MFRLLRTSLDLIRADLPALKKALYPKLRLTPGLYAPFGTFLTALLFGPQASSIPNEVEDLQLSWVFLLLTLVRLLLPLPSKTPLRGFNLPQSKFSPATPINALLP